MATTHVPPPRAADRRVVIGDAAARPPAVAGRAAAPAHRAVVPRAGLRCLVLAAAYGGGVVAAASVGAWLRPSPLVHGVALMLHLVCLVVAFGAVLTVDFHGLRDARAGQQHRTLRLAAQTNPLIWLGLVGLLASGAALEPHPHGMTLVKLAAVVVVGWNGLLFGYLLERSEAIGMRTLMLFATVSQVCWWTAFVIGFLNSQSR